ncbi:oxidoreductase [Pseudomonas sp. Bout1]|uniref:oxidoreductase n=1 Tax=Pseudomonas sp. Bout1 TaxID=3048600 RepID=UPI002AB4340A|nr:oxidoreductase [Pseudomonas sp. Bout1]MDY7533217.1 oxidoreductase [Pseudomonas sp. Bout1]MEB0183782.1 oxidoreductase [Pseudomonas sp. Bout1]
MSSLKHPASLFEGRKAIVSGGSRGIGSAVAQRLIDGGAQVAVLARSRHPQTPAEALFIEVDLSCESGVTVAAEHAVRELGGLDILINNAGAGQPQLPDSSAITDRQWVDSLNINLMAAVRLTTAVLSTLKRSEFGVIINLSAGCATPAPGAMLHYLSAKAALNTYSLGLGNELAPYGIRVNVVTPGPISSPGGDAFRKVILDAMDMDVQAMVEQVPLRRLGTTQEVADMIAFLVSDQGRWLTMHNYFVDGGMAAL